MLFQQYSEVPCYNFQFQFLIQYWMNIKRIKHYMCCYDDSIGRYGLTNQPIGGFILTRQQFIVRLHLCVHCSRRIFIVSQTQLFVFWPHLSSKRFPLDVNYTLSSWLLALIRRWTKFRKKRSYIRTDVTSITKFKFWLMF